MTQIIRGLATIIALWFVTFPAFAAVSIVATVNGDPITSYELEQRVALLADATNIEITDQNREVITSDALQMLIDDKLKLQVSIVGKPGIEGVIIGCETIRQVQVSSHAWTKSIESATSRDEFASLRAVDDLLLDPRLW